MLFTRRVGDSTSTSTEPLTTQNAAVADGLGRQRLNQLIAQALMVAFAMIVLDELANGSPEGCFTDKNDRSRQDSLIVRTKRSAYALRFGEPGVWGAEILVHAARTYS